MPVLRKPRVAGTLELLHIIQPDVLIAQHTLLREGNRRSLNQALIRRTCRMHCKRSKLHSRLQAWENGGAPRRTDWGPRMRYISRLSLAAISVRAPLLPGR